jgi:hypothetical protein
MIAAETTMIINMTKKVKITFAIGLQLAVIGSIGSFVNWPYMKPVLITAGIFFAIAIVLFIIDNSKD